MMGLAANGWQLFGHPLFIDQLNKLIRAVERERAKKPKTYRDSANAKTLAAIFQLAFSRIPEDPSRAEYRQGQTLGQDRKHWFRAKFGSQRFRLFFRYDSKAKIIVYAWVNDRHSLRTYGSKTDAYAMFRSLLDKGNPPDDWGALLGASNKADASTRFAETYRRIQKDVSE